MAVRAGQTFFSTGCPAAYEYFDSVPVRAGDFNLDVHAYNDEVGGGYESVAWFGSDIGTESGEERLVSGDASKSYELKNPDGDVLIHLQMIPGDIDSLGGRICQRIAECPGPVLLADSVRCPAFNQDTIVEEATNIVNER